MLKILVIPNIHESNSAANPRPNRFNEIIECVRECIGSNRVYIVMCVPPNPIPFFTDNIDVVLCNRVTPRIQELCKPIIICDRFDSTPTSACRDDLGKENVIGYFKDYVFKNADNFTRFFLYHRYHFNSLNDIYDIVPEKDVIRYNKPNSIPPDKIPLIKCVTWNLHQYSNVAHHFMDMLTNDTISYEDKKIDVFMVCHMHDKHPVLCKHRTDGLHELDAYKKKYNIVCQTEPLDPKDYFSILKQSKVCIAPYGLGERIALDQYGILSGCIVIKPPMDHLICDPNIYETGEKLIETCNMDFSNLEDILQGVLGQYNDRYKKIAMDRRSKLITYDKQYYADRFFGVLAESLYNHDPVKYASIKPDMV